MYEPVNKKAENGKWTYIIDSAHLCSHQHAMPYTHFLKHSDVHKMASFMKEEKLYNFIIFSASIFTEEMQHRKSCTHYGLDTTVMSVRRMNVMCVDITVRTVFLD